MNEQHSAVVQMLLFKYIVCMLKSMFKHIHLLSGAFLIPYAICLVTSGLPVFLLELGLGQYMSTGSIGAWRIVPGLQGKSLEFRGHVFIGNQAWVHPFGKVRHNSRIQSYSGVCKEHYA